MTKFKIGDKAKRFNNLNKKNGYTLLCQEANFTVLATFSSVALNLGNIWKITSILKNYFSGQVQMVVHNTSNVFVVTNFDTVTQYRKN